MNPHMVPLSPSLLPTHQKSRAVMEAEIPPQLEYIEKYAPELQCPLCKRIMTDPVYAKECLHRFCSPCINKRVVAKGGPLTRCPKCERALPGRDSSFRPDLTLAPIIAKLRARRKPMPRHTAIEAATFRRDGVDVDSYLSAHLRGGPSRHNGLSDKEREREKERKRLAKPNEDANRPSTSAAAALELSPLRPHPHSQMLTTPSKSSRPSSGCSFSPGGGGVGMRQRLKRGCHVEVVLYPDGSIFRQDQQLPACLRRPRYLLAPKETKIAHLCEYLLMRTEAEMGAPWKGRKEFLVELTMVEETPDEISLCLSRARDIRYLNQEDNLVVPGSLRDKDCILVVKNSGNGRDFNIMLTLVHPFRALSPQGLVEDIVGGKRPLKLVYRLVEKRQSPSHNSDEV